ncbi:tyrosine-protein phosphatase [Streptomyces griseomycini]|uniref:tyrosine-protein phosphatase n=1 Tax=Streptomyces griseomycini TaxID=66895 RepID=UPI0035713C30
MVLGLLGVTRETVVEDFALSDRAAPALLAEWTARSDGRAPAWPASGRAPAEVTELFLTALAARHGSPGGVRRPRPGRGRAGRPGHPAGPSAGPGVTGAGPRRTGGSALPVSP